MQAVARVTCLRIPVSSGAFCPWLLPLHGVSVLLHLPRPSSSSSLAPPPCSLAHSARTQSSCHSALPSQGCCCPGNTGDLAAMASSFTSQRLPVPRQPTGWLPRDIRPQTTAFLGGECARVLGQTAF